MEILGIILARAGSKGLPDKCVRELRGRAVIEYTFEHAVASRRLSAVVLSTDSAPAKELARKFGIEVIDRPAELATDTATVDAAGRHAVESWESRHGNHVDAIVLLYGNVPVRGPGLIDRAIDHLLRTRCDSVRTVAPVGKFHPDWTFRLDGDRMIPYRPNSIYRRQDLEPLFYLDGAIAVLTREALFNALKTPADHQAFLGHDRRAIIQRPGDAVDIDARLDLLIAEAVLLSQSEGALGQTGSGAVAPINVGSHRIGPGYSAFVVAEAGVNHNGSVETALRLVDAAVEAGADAVKFQMFRAADLTTASAPTAAYQEKSGGERSQRDLLKRLELLQADFIRIKRHADERGIFFLATPFGEKELRALVELGVPALKFASTDLTNTPLLDAGAATGLPLLLSTGASSENEIAEAVERLHRAGAMDRLMLLHCVSCYPTPLDAVNLRAIRALEHRFGVVCGLSDHTTSITMGALAVAAGARVLEKHFTLDRQSAGPDHAMSLEPDPLMEYVAAVRAAETAMGDGHVGLTGLEREVRLVAGKSVVAACGIPAGARLQRDMLAVRRPGTGISPVELAKLLNRRAAVEIPSDTILTWDMVQ